MILVHAHLLPAVYFLIYMLHAGRLRSLIVNNSLNFVYPITVLCSFLLLITWITIPLLYFDTIGSFVSSNVANKASQFLLLSIPLLWISILQRIFIEYSSKMLLISQSNSRIGSHNDPLQQGSEVTFYAVEAIFTLSSAIGEHKCFFAALKL